MPADKNFIAVDIGATSGRVILGTLSGGRLRTECVHRFPNGSITVGGRLYWDIYAIFGEIRRGLSEVARRGVRVESIGIDTWGVDFVCVAGDGELLSLPRAYRDPRFAGVPQEFFRKVPGREVYDRTGIQIMDFNTLYQLYAMSCDGSSSLRAAESLLFMPDAISYMLTGERVCEHTILSTSQLMDPRTKSLDTVLLGAAGVAESLFPRRVMPGETVGCLRDDVAAGTGLGRVPVVAVAGHDTASAVAAVPAEGRNFAYLSSGTWSLMGLELDSPVIGDASFGGNFTNEGGVGGKVRFLKNITGMWLLEQCLVSWKRAGRNYSYDDVVRLASEMPASPETMDPDAPEFVSPQDMPAAIAAYCRRCGIGVPASDAATMRLIFDSLAAKYASVLASLRAFAPFDIETLHVIGGGARNGLLNRLTAAAAGIRVVAGPAEATAMGNIMVQAAAAGAVPWDGIRRTVRDSVELEIYEPEKI